MKYMSKSILKFPSNFLWGVSTSAYQIEGGITNDWSQWEVSPARIKSLEKQGLNPADFICGQACNSFKLWRKDIELVKNLNCGAYRFGLEWARIEPEPGKFSQEAIDHYAQILQTLKSEGLQTVVTLWHWTMPVWVVETGGWANKKTIEYFSRYVKKVVEQLGQNIDWWVTLNEPRIHIANGYLAGKFPPQKKSLVLAYRVSQNLAAGHIKAYKIIHQAYPKAQVSITHLVDYFEPARKWCPVEQVIAKLDHYFVNDYFLQKVKNYLDYIGLDYYFHNRMVWYPPFRRNKNELTTDMGWEIYPAGIYEVLKYLSQFSKPILILENGLADAVDDRRPDFIVNHLRYVHKAIEEGVDVRGYFYWSLLDNFEWAAGWAPKFGLYAVDRETFERIPRPSARLYAKICQSGEVEVED
jgi:beta-glucosidase